MNTTGLSARIQHNLAHMPLFWRFQIGGWLVHAVVSLPFKMAASETIRSAVLFTLAAEPFGLLLSCGLRLAYRRLALGPDRPLRLVTGVLGCSSVAAAIDWFVVSSIQQPGRFEFTWSFLVFAFTWLRGINYVGWSALYFGIKGAIAARARAMSLIRAETAAREAELQMLRAQINPHFLFNALNTVLAGIRPDQTALAEVVQGLSDYLRYSLAHRHSALVPLGEEFDAALNYLAVEKARFRDGLVVETHIDESARSLSAPGVFLQPLIENAVKHGYKTSPVPLRLRVDIRSHPAGGAVIEVTNSGRWIEPSAERRADDAAGHGLESVKRRLALMYPNTHRFESTTSSDQVSIRIHLPAASPLTEIA
jgi:sensor histidine kinase YesM